MNPHTLEYPNLASFQHFMFNNTSCFNYMYLLQMATHMQFWQSQSLFNILNQENERLNAVKQEQPSLNHSNVHTIRIQFFFYQSPTHINSQKNFLLTADMIKNETIFDKNIPDLKIENQCKEDNEEKEEKEENFQVNVKTSIKKYKLKKEN